MKVLVSALVISCLAALSLARPQEGAQFTDEAIRQAQQSYLIPQDAKIQKVERGIELASYESIPARQKIDLFSILGDQVPRDVIARLQPQVDNIGYDS
ncbi:uncharacterized protein LOC132260258 [Phlebotomus argentipes]|uniref:uncharacterized protein LOC132260258 n=1 Tax=Phlebotomus argentipes TaxID=94469 RepID=UPI002892FCA4|nr:uncharacterized protein LOC132260258 [Phlebotomus argentipes]